MRRNAEERARWGCSNVSRCIRLRTTLANLRAMETMRRAFGVPVGFSDHTTGVAVPVAAAALGAAFIEKHLTLDRASPGRTTPLHSSPTGLKALVDGVRAAEAALGTGAKDGPAEEERGEMYRLGRRSLVFTRDAPAGTLLSRDLLTTKRPGFGVKPKYLELVLGRAPARRG